MAQHGVNVSDPAAAASPQLASAGHACAHYAAALTSTPVDPSAFRANILKWARCMRANGFPQQDPVFPPSGGADFMNADPHDPRFAAAAPKCQQLLASAKGAGK